MLDRRWIALVALCMGVVMIVLDGTVVTVALPLIRADLGFTQASLVWVVNAYILTFGGTDVIPGTTLFTIGAGIAGSPLFLSAVHGVAPKDSGLASGLIGTSSMVGGSLGLAILAAAAEAWTRKLTELGADPMVALIGGYHVAFATGAALAVVTSALGLMWLPTAIHRCIPAPAPAQ